MNTIARFEAGYDALTGTMQRIEDVFRNEGVGFVEDGTSIGVTMRLEAPHPPEAAPHKKSKTKTKSSRK